MTAKPDKRFTFRKTERLSRKKDIKELFEKGSSFFLYPFKVLYLSSTEDEVDNRILISVPKKLVKSAVKRNLLKRRIRESYRLNKHIIAEGTSSKYFIAYIYVARDVLDYKEVETKLKKVLQRLRDISGKENTTR